MDLRKATEKELLDELARREKELKDTRIAKQADRVSLVTQALPHLLLLVKHSRTSCSDITPGFPERDCVRCALIRLQEYGEFPFVLRFEIEDFNVNRDQD